MGDEQRALAPDPIPEVHQVLALLAYDEIEPIDRSALEWARERLVAVSKSGSPAAWLDWYRECLSLIRHLTTRWQSRKDAQSSATTAPAAHSPFALSRVRDTGSAFVQRWQVRLSDHATTLKQRLVSESEEVKVVIQESDTLLAFRIPQDDQNRFGDYVGSVLNDWSRHVEAKLATTWYQHLRDIVHAERLPSGPIAPPPWRHPPLTSSTRLIPNVAMSSTRRVSKSIAALGALGSSNALSIAVSVAVLGATLRNLDREAATTIEEQCRGVHDKLSAWAGTSVDAHRSRLGALLTSTLDEMKTRLAEWTDAAWPSRAAQPPAPGRGPPDLAPLEATASRARSAIATRIAQIELEMKQRNEIG